MKNENLIKVGLKAGANWLFSEMHGNTHGGVESRFYRSVVFLDNEQWGIMQKMIVASGYDLKKSVATDGKYGADFSIYLVK